MWASDCAQDDSSNEETYASPSSGVFRSMLCVHRVHPFVVIRALADGSLALTLLVLFALLIAPTPVTGLPSSPGAFGSVLLTISSGSMAPAINVGDAVLARTDIAARDVSEGDVVVFRSAANHSLVITHRVIAATVETGGHVTLTTAGDANRHVDSTNVTDDQLIGRVTGRSAVIGRLIAASTTVTTSVLFATGSLLAHLAIALTRTANTDPN